MKNVISLAGVWQLAGFDDRRDRVLPDSGFPEGVQEIEGHVPGEVHVDLLRAELIPDPFYGLNADQVQWVEQKHWWYKRTVVVEKDFVQKKTLLEFDGLDTYATVFFNGRELGKTDNMFVPHKFDVSGLVRAGENAVAVRFDPAAKVVQQMDHSHLFGCFDTPRVNVRKMQCAFGWDWTHRLVGAGIWREARLVSYGDVSIADVRIDPEVRDGYADAWITIELDNHADEDVQVMASVVVALGGDRETVEATETVPPAGGTVEAVIRIEQPELWWPNGFGEPTLYTCMVGIESEGEVEDVAQRKFGVRDVRLAEFDEKGDRVFTLLVNGEEIFCKGGNWVPADHFVSNVAEDRYRELITLARDANFNMLRVWGGGIYEADAFYDACDEMGIMILQDFMFSCATYPDDEEFCRKVAEETASVVRRLRNHPCVVVWAGNNECEMNYGPDEDWQGKKLFHEVIPNVLRTLDTSRPYRPCCSWGGKTGNDPAEGDWHGGSWFAAYLGDHTRWRHMIEEERGLFVSEFVTQGPPVIGSLREFIPGGKLFPPTDEVWEYHNKDNPHSGRTDGASHEQILEDLTHRMMGDYESAEQFAAYAGILQGEFVKAEVEHYRREKWAISGALFWMYNDCWPAIGWSVVDYYLRPKIAYYYAKRAFAPVIVSFKQLEDRVQAFVTSDERLSGIDGTLRVGVFSFGSCGFDVQEVPMSLAANTSQAFWESDPLDEILSDPGRQCLVALLDVQGKTVAGNVYFARTFGEMQFPQPRLLVQRAQLDENRFAMTISADDYARNVAIANLPARARPSNNYFDVLPGEMREVTIDDITSEQAADLTICAWRR